MPVPQEHFPVIGWSHPDNVNEQFGKVLGIFKTDPPGQHPFFFINGQPAKAPSAAGKG